MQLEGRLLRVYISLVFALSDNIASVCEVAVPGEARVGAAAACGGAASSSKLPDSSRRVKGHLCVGDRKGAGAANTVIIIRGGLADDI